MAINLARNCGKSSFNLTQYEQYELLQNPSDRSKYYHIRTTQTRLNIHPWILNKHTNNERLKAIYIK